MGWLELASDGDVLFAGKIILILRFLHFSTTDQAGSLYEKGKQDEMTRLSLLQTFKLMQTCF